MNKQQLPEGIEWPRFEDGALVKPWDVMIPSSFAGTEEIESIIFDDEGAGVKTTSGNYWYAPKGGRILRPPVIGGDSQNIKVGDTVYGQYGEKFKVDGFDYQSAKIVKVIDENRFIHRYAPKDLTHTPPDSWERLDEDARKGYIDYWSCRGVKCCDCPAKVDGKTPRQRYDTQSCSSAIAVDILARAKKLAGVSGDE